MMESKSIAHIGIAVKDLDECVKFYRDVLGLEFEGFQQLGDLKAAFMKAGETRIELLQSTTADTAVAKFIAARGEGIHHIAYEVDDIGRALAELEKNGTQMIDSKPRPGAHGSLIAFIHPSSSFGVLTELVQPGR